MYKDYSLKDSCNHTIEGWQEILRYRETAFGLLYGEQELPIQDYKYWKPDLTTIIIAICELGYRISHIYSDDTGLFKVEAEGVVTASESDRHRIHIYADDPTDGLIAIYLHIEDMQGA